MSDLSRHCQVDHQYGGQSGYDYRRDDDAGLWSCRLTYVITL
ncbi:hypothetical protein ACK17L_23645 [Escherichia coli]